ncbi:class I SAM-dependent methyltransferase [Dactylosporangium sp. CS-047395]|uniref:class I SAM-dependent methyltransferase n=1 Tax=Dactylosporangium sp. CS-047395 TaxID=3239936 RepID=UPI003D8A335E
MTSTVSRPAIDPARWPDVAAVPDARLRARIAAALLHRIVARLPLRVRYPDGTTLGTAGPALVLHRPDAFRRRVGAAGLIGLGESYQAGDWDADDLTGLFAVLATHVGTIVPRPLQVLRHVHGARTPRATLNTAEGSRRNIHHHYDLSNELFALFLDETMSYSAALFDADPAAATWACLPAAQDRKIDRLLDATRVGTGTRLLEIGTGWGELAIRAARRGATVHSVTLSVEQRDLALRRARAAGVADRVDVRLCDYREIAPLAGGYDAVLSVEMVEAVGERFWPDYAATVERHLAPGGRAGIQLITMAHERMRATRSTYTWIHKYVFPGGLIPSVRAMREAFAARGLGVADDLAFGRHYEATLRLWRERFTARAGELSALGFDDTFRRTWDFYLAYCEAGFRTGYLDVHHLILERGSR